MSFALRSSLTSRSSSAIRCASAVESPGLRPESTSAWFTQWRNDSAPTPSSRATRVIVPCFSPVSRRVSNTIRTARSRISSGYLCGRGCRTVERVGGAIARPRIGRRDQLPRRCSSGVARASCRGLKAVQHSFHWRASVAGETPELVSSGCSGETQAHDPHAP